MFKIVFGGHLLKSYHFVSIFVGICHRPFVISFNSTIQRLVQFQSIVMNSDVSNSAKLCFRLFLVNTC